MDRNGAVTDDSISQFDSLQPPLRVDRRGFVKTTLGAGFAAAVLPVQAKTMTTTDSNGLTAGEVKIQVAGGEMVAYRAQPARKTNLPVVLVVQEIFGVHEYIRDVTRRLAKLGYLAIAPELYARQGDRVLGRHSDIESLYTDERFSRAQGLMRGFQRLSEADRRIAAPVDHSFSKTVFYADPPYHTHARLDEPCLSHRGVWSACVPRSSGL